MNNPTTRGGARKGAGRKTLPPEQVLKTRTIRLTDGEWLVLKERGLEWLRSQLKLPNQTP